MSVIFCRLMYVGEPQGFQVNVTPTANYPLDIYILMDLSFSMTPYLNNLRDVAVALGKYHCGAIRLLQLYCYSSKHSEQHHQKFQNWVWCFQ